MEANSHASVDLQLYAAISENETLSQLHHSSNCFAIHTHGMHLSQVDTHQRPCCCVTNLPNLVLVTHRFLAGGSLRAALTRGSQLLRSRVVRIKLALDAARVSERVRVCQAEPHVYAGPSSPSLRCEAAATSTILSYRNIHIAHRADGGIYT